MSNEPEKKPKIDWAGQLRYTLFMIVAIVAFLAVMRYMGLRG